MHDYIEGFRLSSIQTRLWALQQYNFTRCAQCAVLIKGKLDKIVLDTALQKVVQRHEILRTNFHYSLGMNAPLQVVAKSAKATIKKLDLVEEKPRERENKIEQLIEEEKNLGLNFESPSLLRVYLVRLSSKTHLLLLTIPTLCADAQTLNNLMREIGCCYDLCIEGQETGCETVSYVRFAEWQNELLEREGAGLGREFWNKREFSNNSIFRPPFGSEGKKKPGDTLLSHKLVIGSGLTAALNSIEQKRGVLKKEFLLACWQTALWKLTAQREITIGVEIDGRRYDELQGALGLFTRTLPASCQFEKAATFDEVLAQVSQSVRDCYKWQEYFSWPENGRNAAKENFFRVGFEFVEYAEPLRVGKVSFSMMRQTACVDRYQLKLKCEKRGEELRAEFSYDGTMYERGEIERLAEQYLSLVASAAAQPEGRLDELSMISAHERDLQLHHWNQTEVRWETPQLIAEWFEYQVARAPEKVAVEFGHERISYRELNERANRLAWHLKERGVGPDIAVGILIERSFEMVISLLGVLKAGGAYVPLDASYPKRRLSYMVKDSGARVVVTEEKSLGFLPENEVEAICVDREKSAIERQRPDNLGIRLEAENLAYVIYTSGSTGQPKGAMITHSGLRNYLTWSLREYNVGEGEGSLLHSPLAFDLTVTALYPPLLMGGRLILVKESEGISGLSAALRRASSLSLVKLTPSHLEVLNQWIPVEELSGRTKALVIGGEALYGERLRKWQSYAPETRLINEYGPTETVVGCCVYEVKAGEEVEGAAPIGRPISNTKLYILNEKQELVGIGESGEMYVGGEGVCRGYVGRADRTAEKFMPNPFSKVGGERFYRTGDMARYRWDGEIEYLGRRDQQVKLKGYRIELGEIEETLNRHEEVGKVAVVMQEEKGERRIVAYVAEERREEEEARVTSRELRAYLEERLPEFMIPERIVMLEEMPLTTNGKINRNALPETGKLRPDSEGAYVAPRSFEEEALAAIWAEVLVLEQIGIYDNFFALGGDSIRSVRVVALANERGFNLTVEDIFQHQTIANLCKELPLSESQRSPDIRTEPFSLINPVDRERLPADIEDAYPLTMLQAGMLYHLELTPDSPAYHNINSFHIRGEFGEREMQETMRQIAARHAVIRTSFDLASYSEPLQLVHKTVFLPIVVKDLRLLSYKEQEEALEAFVENERQKAFDLSCPPLMRIHVHLRSEDTYQFTLTEMHFISDGWSTSSMFAEILNRMAALLHHEPVPDQTPTPTSFRDYVAMELAALQSQEFRQFWDKKLQDCAPVRLPRWPASANTREFPEGDDEEPLVVSQLFKWPTRGGRSTREQRLDFPVRNEIVEGLKRLARDANVPLKSVLLAAHVKVMSILSGQPEIITGLVANGRPEVVDGIDTRGLFLNTLPFRFNLSNGSWIQLAQATFEAERELLPFRRYPMAALQQAWGQEPLIDTLFSYLHFHAAEGAIDSGKAELLDHGNIDWAETNFTLSAIFHKGPFPTSFPYEFMFSLFYEIESLCAEQARDIYGYYDRVLKLMASEPHSQHQAQSFLSTREQTRLLIEWNDTQVDYPRQQTIHQLFETQVDKSPNAIAVTFGDEQLTYLELNSRANQLAHHLCELGVGPDTRVAILLERSVDLVVAQLATLKCGAAYVPIDPTFPGERQVFMARDCNARAIITTREARLAEAITSHRVDIDDPRLSNSPSGNLELPLKSEMAAYVMYTSGSTGKPKGVVIRHQGIARLVINCGYADFKADDRVAFAANPAFDAATMEVWGPLLNGGRIVVIAQNTLLESARFAEALKRHQVSVVWMTAGHFHQCAESLGVAIRSLRYLMVGGDKLDTRVIARTLRDNPPQHLINGYGPTESTTFATTHEIKIVAEGAKSIPLGGPIGNTQIYILDVHRQPTPIGVAGEIYIGGDGVGREYLNHPELTAEKFLPDPFSREPGARMYKTGDLGRWLPDGTVEFLGRNDFQVKIRGFRIEPVEIEAKLAEHPEVREAVVLVRKDITGGKQLVAYFTGGEIGAEALRVHLLSGLPEYMIPSAYVRLESLPLTPNGKLDRKALPAPEGQAYVTRGYDPPVGETETRLALIWSNLLKIEQVGRRDNFFELGGHSLLAVQLLSRVRHTLGMEVLLADLFAHPALADFALTVENASQAKIPPIIPIDRDRPLELSFAQQRLWFVAQFEGASEAYHVAGGLRLKGELDRAALRRALDRIVARHEALRTTFSQIDGRPAQIIGPAENGFALQEHDLRHSADAAAELHWLAAREAMQPFDLEHGPLIRGRLAHIADDDHALLLSMHHIVSDGWSMGILIREVGALYRAYSSGEESPLAELPIQYADFAVWQRQWLQGEVIENQLAYWKRQLGGELPVLELPTDRPRPARPTHRGAECYYGLSTTLSTSLNSLSLEHNCTLFMTLLAAFKTLLYYLTGQTDIVVGTDIANRDRVEVENLIGFFVNQLVLRQELSPNSTFVELLKKVRAMTLEAYTHQDLPFEMLVETLNPDRDESRTPLFQVKIVLQNTPVEKLSLPGLTLTPIGGERSAAKFDLVLNLYDIGGGLGALLEYSADLFEESTARRILNRFHSLLERIVDRPGAKLQELVELLIEEDRGEQLKKDRELENVLLRKFKSARRRAINER
jgi:amino acid adenylation domain-containing protein